MPRSRTVPELLPEFDINWTKKGPGVVQPPESFTSHYNCPAIIARLYEVASDLPIGSTRGHPNPFSHYKRTCKVDFDHRNIETVITANWPQYHQGTVSDPRVGYVGGYVGWGGIDQPTGGLSTLFDSSKIYTGDYIIPYPNLDAIALQSFKGLLPGIRPNLSLLNFIYELKDFKSLPRTISRLSSIPRKGNKTLRKILGGGSDGYLQAQFNILPLLRDITNLRNAVKNTRKQIESFLSNEGIRRKVHHSIEMTSLYPDSSNATDWRGWPNQINTGLPDHLVYRFKSNRLITYGRRHFTCTLEYSYAIPGWQRENATLLGYSDALGINLNPAIIWNAIPWTFVVDWVLGVSQWLDQTKSKNLHPVTVIYNWSYSQSTSRTVKVYTDVEPTEGLGGFRFRNCEINEEAYRRFTGVPSLESAISGSGINSQEFMLASALALSRLR